LITGIAVITEPMPTISSTLIEPTSGKTSARTVTFGYPRTSIR
jgi:hypothetical protein